MTVITVTTAYPHPIAAGNNNIGTPETVAITVTHMLKTEPKKIAAPKRTLSLLSIARINIKNKTTKNPPTDIGKYAANANHKLSLGNPLVTHNAMPAKDNNAKIPNPNADTIINNAAYFRIFSSQKANYDYNGNLKICPAVLVVISATFSKLTFLTSASFLAVSTMYAGSLRRPRYGSGDIGRVGFQKNSIQ